MANFPKLATGTELAVGSHQTTIVEYLSEGGFAHIYKVHIDPPEAGSDIACLKRVIVPDKSGLDQLRKEVEVMKTLKLGRNIVRYYDSHAERLENGTYQVLVLMELCSNNSLLHHMNAHIKTKLAEPEILKIMLDIAQGIYEMHKLKLIHRDIKIENVLIDSENQFKLCDFGSTSSRINPPKDQREFQLISHDILYQTTPQYRSPEMIDLYKGSPIDEKSDIWAFGCFSYKLCYYTTPFEANGDVAILHALFNFPSLPVFSGDLKNLIIIMLQENPTFRPNIVQVIMLLSKMLKIDFKDLALKDFYKAGPYNFQALHEYQHHKQQEIAKQQMYQQQQQQKQQQSLSQSPPLLSQSVEPSLIQSSNLQPPLSRVPQEQYIPQPNVKTTSQEAVRYNGEALLSMSSKKSLSLIQSNPDQDTLEGQDNFTEFDNFDNVAERYPSIDEFVDTPQTSKPSDPSIDSLSRKASRDPPADEFKDSRAGKPTPLNRVPSFSRKEAWEKQQSTLNGEAVKLVDDIFASSNEDQNSKRNSFSSTHSGKSFHDKNDRVNTKQHEKIESPDSSDADLDEIATNIHEKFPEIPNEIITKIKTQDKEEALGLLSRSQRSSQANLLRKSLDANLPQQNAYYGDSSSPALNSQEVSTKPLTLNTLPFSLNSPGKESAKGSIPAPFQPKYDLLVNLPLNNPNFNTKNPFPLPNQELKGQGPVNVEDGKKYANPWEKYRNKGQIADISTALPPPLSPQVPAQTYQTSPTLKMHENFELLNLNHNNAVRTPIPELDSYKGEDLSRIVSSNKIDTPTYRADLNKPVHKPGVDLNDVNMKLRTKSDDGNRQNSYYGNLSLKDSRRVRKSSEDELRDVNLIDLEAAAHDSGVATPNLRREVPGEEPSLLDIDAEGEKLQEKIKKRISSIQDQKWAEEVIDFASDDEDPVNQSRMSRLSIRSSLKNPKRKSGEHKRSESLNYDSNPEPFY